MLASPEVRQAIKDSRGKCRSRWLGHHAENARPQRGHFPANPSIGTRLVHGRPRPKRGHSRRGHGHGHGLTTDAVAVTASDCSRTWSVRDHGITADADAGTDWMRARRGRGLDTAPDRTRTARGYGHRRGHLAGQIADSPRLFRGRKNLVLTRSKACPIQNR